MIERGLTLIEVLISMSIAMVVGVLLMAIIVQSAGLYSKESSKLSVGLNINDVLAKVRETIKESNGVVVSYIGGGVSYSSGSAQIVFKLSSLDSSNNIISSKFDYFVFFLDQGKLRLKTFPDVASSRKMQNQIFSTLVESLNFQYFNSANPPVEVLPQVASKIRISLTLKQKNGSSIERKTATSEANLRND